MHTKVPADVRRAKGETVVVRFPRLVSLTVLISGAGALLSQRVSEWRADYVPAQIVLTMLAAFLPLLTSFMFKRLKAAKSLIVGMSASPESTSSWWDHALDCTFGGLRPYILGALLVIVGIPTIMWSWVPWSGWVLFVYYLSSALLLFLTGVAGWAFLRLLMSLHQLSKIGLKVLPFIWPQAEIGAIHGMLMQIFAGGLLAYLLAVFGIWSSPGGAWFLTSGPVGLWVIPLAATVVLFFGAVEYYIHALLEESKRERLRQLSEIIQEKFLRWRESGSKEDGAAVTEVLKWRDAIQAERSWPLDVLSMISVVVGVFIPAAKALKELIA
jgi:hypothetical protein